MTSGAMLERLDGLSPKTAGTLLLSLLVSLFVISGPASAQTSTAVKSEFPVSTFSSDKLKPAVSGNIVVWQDDRNGQSNIYAKNISTGQEFLVAEGIEAKRKPVTNGGFVVWEEDRNGNSDIYGKNLSGGTTPFVIADGPGDQRKPSISGSTVAYESKNSDGRWHIYTYNLSSRQSTPVSTGSAGNTMDANPVVSGDLLVWQDDRNGVGTSVIYAKNLKTGEEFQVGESGKFQDQPSISGGVVVWRQESVANYDIFGRDLYAKDLETGKVFQVTTNSQDQVAPAVSGSLVVWEDYRNGAKPEIWGKDLSKPDSPEFQVASSADPLTSPAVSGETVVWESQRTDATQTNYGLYDIEGAEVEAAPATPAGIRATGSLNGVSVKWAANTEPDLAGYNVYRSGSADGVFTRLNQGLLTSPSFSDAGATKGSVSYYQVEAVDTLGNKSLPARTNAAATARSSVSLSASPAVIDYGAATALSGKLTAEGKPLSGKQVVVEQKPAGASNFSAIVRRTTGPDGAFRVGGLKPKKNTFYRVRFAGERNILGSAAGKAVKVRAKVSLSKPNVPKVNRDINITGRVNTTRNGQVNVVIRRNGKVVARKTVRLADFSYHSTYRINRPGRYTVQVTASNTNANIADTVRRSFSAG